MPPPSSLYHSKNRIVAIDIVRIIAAFAVMIEHADFFGGNSVVQFISDFPVILAPLSPLFFVLAGYFACRNITWNKALNNAWWCFAPFILWNTIQIVFCYLFYRHELSADHSILSLFGIGRISFESGSFFPSVAKNVAPLNYPLWFMRDLIFLFLLSPVICRWARIIFPALLLASFIPAFSSHFIGGIEGGLLSGCTLAYFAGGCMLQTLSKDIQRRALTFYCPPFIIGYIALMSLDALFLGGVLCHSQSWYLCKTLFGLWIFYQIARWVEVKIPQATPFALKYAPVTFLTFAAHVLFFKVFRTLSWHINPQFPFSSPLPLLYPPIVAVIMSLFFFALKRWCPSLLHLVAHYKLRPDDLNPTAKP